MTAPITYGAEGRTGTFLSHDTYRQLLCPSHLSPTLAVPMSQPRDPTSLVWSGVFQVIFKASMGTLSSVLTLNTAEAQALWEL
jgi:hypothetical protein